MVLTLIILVPMMDAMTQQIKKMIKLGTFLIEMFENIVNDFSKFTYQ